MAVFPLGGAGLDWDTPYGWWCFERIAGLADTVRGVADGTAGQSGFGHKKRKHPLSGAFLRDGETLAGAGGAVRID